MDIPCAKSNPWASLVPPFLSKRMRAFQKSKKVHGVTRRVSHGWLKRQMLGCIYLFLGVKLHIGLPLKLLWQLSPQVSIRRIVEKTTITLHQGQLYTRD
jgi:hypothetical protein